MLYLLHLFCFIQFLILASFFCHCVSNSIPHIESWGRPNLQYSESQRDIIVPCYMVRMSLLACCCVQQLLLVKMFFLVQLCMWIESTSSPSSFCILSVQSVDYLTHPFEICDSEMKFENFFKETKTPPTTYLLYFWSTIRHTVSYFITVFSFLISPCLSHVSGWVSSCSLLPFT